MCRKIRRVVRVCLLLLNTKVCKSLLRRTAAAAAVVATVLPRHGYSLASHTQRTLAVGALFRRLSAIFDSCRLQAGC